MKGPAAMSKIEEARRAFADGLDLDRALAKENPQVDVYRLDLLGILSRAAALELVAGRLDACSALVNESRAIFGAINHRENNYPYVKPEMSGIFLVSAYALAQEGRLAEALEGAGRGRGRPQVHDPAGALGRSDRRVPRWPARGRPGGHPVGRRAAL